MESSATTSKFTSSRFSKPTVESGTTGARPSSAKTKKQKLPTTYKDWQVKEEERKTLRKSATATLKSTTVQTGAKAKKPAQLAKTQKRNSGSTKRLSSNSKSRERVRSASNDTHEFKSRVQTQFNNFINQVEAGQIFDDNSLLQDSQAELPKEEKKKLLVEQRARRKTSELEKKKQAEADAKRKQDNIKALNLRFKSQMITFKKEKVKLEREQERQKRITAKQVTKLVERHRPEPAATRTYNTASAQEQMTDLRNWIEQQMEQVNHSNQETPSVQEPSQSAQLSDQQQELPQPGISVSVKKTAATKKTAKSKSKEKGNLSMEKLATKDSQKVKMLKHQLPGNSLLAENEEKKLGARKDRYGAFNSNNNDFDRVVEIQKHKQDQREQKGGKTAQTPPETKYSAASQQKGKEALAKQVKELAERANMKLEQNFDDESFGEQQSVGEEDELTEDSCDKVPVKESKYISFDNQVRERVVLPAKPSKTVTDEGSKPPGVGSLKGHFQRYESIKLEKEGEAVLVIQKFLRGHWGRRDAARVKFTKAEENDLEYGQFDRDIKFNGEFNLNRYLDEKKKLRAKNGFADSISMDEISEAIGESASFSKDKMARSGQSAQLQNFFSNNQRQAATMNDPLSLISIFAKRNGKIPTDQEQAKLGTLQSLATKKQSSSSSRDRRHSRSKQAQQKRRHGSKGHLEDVKDSIIDEEIYTESFEDSIPNASGSISEDIPQISVTASNNTASGSVKTSGTKLPTVKETNQRNIFGFRTKTKEPAAEIADDDSIAVESFAEKISEQKSDDIPEESYLGITGSKKTKDEEESIMEESIIREEYDNDEFESYNASQSLAARNRVRFGMASAQISTSAPAPQITREEKKKQADLVKLEEEKSRMTNDRKRMVGELLGEMRDYETSCMSTQMVDRMEKVVASSLAQKDQLIMAQRLHELTMEKNHKEEINKIREEQIRLMSQLMLLGAGAGGSNVTQEQRDGLLESIQKIVEKPIEIKKEEVHVSYSVPSVAPDAIHVSGSIPRSHRQSYLEEYEASKRSKPQNSSGKYSDFIDEDFALRSGMSKSKNTNSIQESFDDIVDEVESMVEDSIKESIDETGSKQSFQFAGHNKPVSNKTSAYEEYKAKKFRDALNNKSAVSQFYNQLELAILKEKEEQEIVLKEDLKKRLISRDAYERKTDELVKWVADERKELKLKHKQVVDSCADTGHHIKKLESDKKKMLGRVVATEIHNVDEDSNDSETVKKALHEAHMLGSGLTGVSAEAKYLAKKRETALKLMQEKEKAIEQALKSKISHLEEENADDLLQKALEIDVEAEAQRRFDLAKKAIEDSQNLESNRSNLTTSKERGENRPNKKVKFASPTAERQNQQAFEYEDRYSSSKASNPIEDSIGESFNFEGSVSQSYNPDASKSNTQSQNQQQPSPRVNQGLDAAASPAASSSHIDTDYSNDFAEESIASNGQNDSKSLKGSKQILQAKAKDLEESNAYSETFEEESLGHSAQLPPKEQKDPTSGSKMQPVQEEESIDESIMEPSKQQSVGSSSARGHSQSAGQQSYRGEEQSLPSEDQEIAVTNRSVDWQIEIAQDSERTAKSGSKNHLVTETEEDYTEDDFVSEEEQIEEEVDEMEDKSSDLNEREDEVVDDLQSCPDDVGKSSMSNAEALIALDADKITEELFDLLVQGYTDDNKFDLNAAKNKVSSFDEEEEFKDKFPWTEDKKPEPEKPKSIQSSISASKTSSKPALTEREKADLAYQKKHENEQAKIKQWQQDVANFLEFMCKRVDLNKFIQSLDKPIEQDPIKVLAQIQAYDDENSTLMGFGDSTGQLAAQQILPPSFFNKVDREFVITKRMSLKNISLSAAEESDQLSMSQQENENMSNVHHYALYEAMNDALDLERPYKTKGEPMPWSKNTRVVRQATTIAEAKRILESAKAKVLEWSATGAGTKFAPLPSHPPPPQDEMGDELPPPPLAEGEEERRNILRQERLSELMTQDIHNNDGLWIDYEIEDTQVRFDLADMVLAHLAGEVADFLVEKGKF